MGGAKQLFKIWRVVCWGPIRRVGRVPCGRISSVRFSGVWDMAGVEAQISMKRDWMLGGRKSRTMMWMVEGE